MEKDAKADREFAVTQHHTLKMILSKDIVDKRILDFYRLRKAREVIETLNEETKLGQDKGLSSAAAHEILLPHSELKLSNRH